MLPTEELFVYVYVLVHDLILSGELTGGLRVTVGETFAMAARTRQRQRAHGSTDRTGRQEQRSRWAFTQVARNRG
jgi:hypothetical protein